MLAKTESLTRGLGDLRLIELPHPVGSISLDILRSLAESNIDSIVKVLTAGDVRSDYPLNEADGSDANARQRWRCRLIPA